MSSGNGRVRLAQADEALLEHLARYRMMLTGVAHREFYPERTRDKAWGRMHALKKAGYLNAYKLPTGRAKYWTLGPAGVAHTGAPDDWTEHLKAQGLKRWMATLLFCLEGETKQKRLTAAELQSEFGADLYHPPLFHQRDYYTEHAVNSDKKLLALIQPAYDNDESLVARKCRGVLERHMEVGSFRSLIARREFVLTILATTNRHREAIRAAVRKLFRPLLRSAEFNPMFCYAVRPKLAGLLNSIIKTQRAPS